MSDAVNFFRPAKRKTRDIVDFQIYPELVPILKLYFALFAKICVEIHLFVNSRIEQEFKLMTYNSAPLVIQFVVLGAEFYVLF